LITFETFSGHMDLGRSLKGVMGGLFYKCLEKFSKILVCIRRNNGKNE